MLDNLPYTVKKNEDDIIKKYYPIEGLRGCAKRLGKRTPSSIIGRASRLGVNLDALWPESFELLRYQLNDMVE